MIKRLLQTIYSLNSNPHLRGFFISTHSLYIRGIINHKSIKIEEILITNSINLTIYF